MKQQGEAWLPCGSRTAEALSLLQGDTTPPAWGSGALAIDRTVACAARGACKRPKAGRAASERHLYICLGRYDWRQDARRCGCPRRARCPARCTPWTLAAIPACTRVRARTLGSGLRSRRVGVAARSGTRAPGFPHQYRSQHQRREQRGHPHRGHMHDYLVHFLGVGLRHVDGVTARNAAARNAARAWR